MLSGCMYYTMGLLTTPKDVYVELRLLLGVAGVVATLANTAQQPATIKNAQQNQLNEKPLYHLRYFFQ